MDKIIRWFKFSNPFKRIPCLFGFHEEMILYKEDKFGNDILSQPFMKLRCMNIYCPLFHKHIKL
jgi:hypothetical protein